MTHVRPTRSNCSLAMSVGWSTVCCELILYICTIRSELLALKVRPFAHAVVWLKDTLLRARQQWMAQQACKSTNYRSSVCAKHFRATRTSRMLHLYGNTSVQVQACKKEHMQHSVHWHFCPKHKDQQIAGGPIKHISDSLKCHSVPFYAPELKLCDPKVICKPPRFFFRTLAHFL